MVFETITFLSIYQYNFEIYDTLKSLKFTDFEKYNKNSFTAKTKYICYILISKFIKHQSDLELGQGESSDFSGVYDT